VGTSDFTQVEESQSRFRSECDKCLQGGNYNSVAAILKPLIRDPMEEEKSDG